MILATIGQKLAVSLMTSWLKKFTEEKLPPGQLRKLWFASKLASNKTLYRISVGYLYRIKLDDQYLLVRGKRIDQFQPVGGARKWYAPALDALETMGVRDDDCLPIDDTSRNDLRVRVPAKNLFDFIRWYNKQKHREVDQTREFQEELIKPGLLPADAFATINVRYLYTVPTFHYSPYFKCQELLYHEVYELLPTAAQEAALRATQQQDHAEYKWVTENLIERLGYDSVAKTKPFAIGEHTRLLITNTTNIFTD
ncbi:HU-CCDC81 and SPOR domain-containing protein [Spirosoma linguale]|uniref:CD-NTase-associated protein 16 NUDIX domain-containing protein n=1 Tax=Spirosoma linguale (strain ATCC 33905 / DSM 74 / LMG 10896 / Claus 1) TaxID=504472 RepID=D2QQQ7_SPILD|nr:hypothetical protein Slin_4860 [Spirosoma linguale DSM 74]